MIIQNALNFIKELDKLKDTYRQCRVISNDRYENSAEHSFSLAMSVMVIAPFSNKPIDIPKTIKMALFHDIVEAYAGDVFHYDKEKVDTRKIETEALDKLLSFIDNDDFKSEVQQLWNEFEDGKTNEAVFLRGLDRFLPMYQNYHTNGYSWIKHGVTKDMALEKNSHIEDSSEELWNYTKKMLEDSQKRGWIN